MAREEDRSQTTQLLRDFRDLRELSVAGSVWNVVQLATALGIAVGSGALVWWHPAWYTVLFAWVIIPTRQHCMLNMSHECMHRTFVRGGGLNEAFGVFCASILGSPFRSTRAHHMAHHRYLATPQDPDSDLHEGADKLTRRGLALHFASGLLGGYAIRTLFKTPAVTVDASTRRGDLRNILVAQAIIAGLMSWGMSWWVYLFFWAAPLGTTTLSLHLLRSFCEHALLPGEELTHSNLLVSCVSNPIERFFLCPFYMNYHAEHHLFAAVPGPRLVEAHQRLRDRSDAPPQIVRTSYARLITRYIGAIQ